MSRGILGVFEKVGLVESDVDELLPPEVPAPSNTISSFGIALAPAPFATTTQVQAQTLTADDQARLAALTAQVYATPSTYVIFQRVRESLGNTADLASVLRVLTAANPGVTPAKVLADIETHLGVVASKRAEFDAQVQNVRIAKLDAPSKEIADLTVANQTAQQQIAERTVRIAQLQQSIQDTTRSITEGSARFKLVEDQLNAPLLQTKQLLSSLT